MRRDYFPPHLFSHTIGSTSKPLRRNSKIIYSHTPNQSSAHKISKIRVLAAETPRVDTCFRFKTIQSLTSFSDFVNILSHNPDLVPVVSPQEGKAECGTVSSIWAWMAAVLGFDGP
jgi:hypothetical protein